MFSKRVIGVLAAAIVVGGSPVALDVATTAPVHAQDDRTCLYRVHKVSPGDYVKVRRKPGKRPRAWNRKYKVVDVLLPGRTTTGTCERSREHWREVKGGSGVTGHVRKRFVKKGSQIGGEASSAPSPAPAVSPAPAPEPEPEPAPTVSAVPAPTVTITGFPLP
ncbi:hypothetical protein [Planomonospora sp. ID82291]|uniref:hypothetical protein n=1 Tax=Planomonospora sp. ID82291 TaxID=2738136 RepID=UPI0018C3682D|nr:hypothetical protein [Planomonospora sp. ID82291]MBG0814244.1 hypothetical protein [Planomonospora sp. ID82291]